MSKTYRVAIPLLSLWLAGWIALSWPAIQDDALIHLRYADHLVRFHFITYDGVHPDYGASSLLYVAVLAGLRMASASADLARAVSSAVHILLFAGLCRAFWVRGSKWPLTGQLVALPLLLLLVMPGAVRWLDDGMETGLVATFASVLALLLHDECVRLRSAATGPGAVRLALMTALGFLVVLLRTELLLLCAVGSGILLCVAKGRPLPQGRKWNGCYVALSLPAGAILAVGFILVTMRTLLPDTARAKSHGLAHWLNPIHDTVVTLAGAMSFGVGLLIFWVVTLVFVVRRDGLSVPTALANCLFPVVLAVASLRGQEIQGVRYFAWTFFFPIVSNILEAGDFEARNKVANRNDGRILIYAFLVLLAIELPFEAVTIFRVLTRRSATMRVFEGQRLEMLKDERGVASDIGYIGYFSGAELCDLAGLVNGAAASSLTSGRRAEACVASDPDFLFVNLSQLGSVARYRDFSTWRVCGRYDFTNVSTMDSHYLIVQPAIEEKACRATGWVSQPLSSILTRPRAER